MCFVLINIPSRPKTQFYPNTEKEAKREMFDSYFVGCLVNGQKVTEDRSVTTTEDPCVTCKCNKGHLTCAKQACPTLNCPSTRIVDVSGECCPHCRGERS